MSQQHAETPNNNSLLWGAHFLSFLLKMSRPWV